MNEKQEPYVIWWDKNGEMRHKTFFTQKEADAFAKKLRRERSLPRDYKPGDKIWIGG